jgi:hypothetical protein
MRHYVTRKGKNVEETIIRQIANKDLSSFSAVNSVLRINSVVPQDMVVRKVE